jgi:single-strand DNA-binding protein
MQRIDIIGHVGQDAEIKDFNGTQVINFSVAVTESYVNKTTGEKTQSTTWFECAKWGNQTQIAQYLKKGQLVFVTGKPQARAWKKQDETLVASLGVNVFDIKLLASPKNDTNSVATPQQNNAQTNTNPQSPDKDEDDSDLPF